MSELPIMIDINRAKPNACLWVYAVTGCDVETRPSAVQLITYSQYTLHGENVALIVNIFNVRAHIHTHKRRNTSGGLS